MSRAWQVVLIVVIVLVGSVLVAATMSPPEFTLERKIELYARSMLNGITLAGLYFLVASGFTLVFGLMRNVNLAHGSLYLLGAYIGWVIGDHTDSWLLAVAAGFVSTAIFGLLLQVGIFQFMQGQDMRQTMVTIGLAIVLADIMLWRFGGEIYRFEPPALIAGTTALPIIGKYSTYRLALLATSILIGIALWLFLAKTRVGMMIRAGVDDRAMLSASGTNVPFVFAVTFAVGAGLAGFAGVFGGSDQSIQQGEDTRFLLVSLVVVIVGGMGSVVGAAVGALLIGVAEQVGQAYEPIYSVVFPFVIMAVVLAFRPQGLLGARA